MSEVNKYYYKISTIIKYYYMLIESTLNKKTLFNISYENIKTFMLYDFYFNDID